MWYLCIVKRFCFGLWTLCLAALQVSVQYKREGEEWERRKEKEGDRERTRLDDAI